MEITRPVPVPDAVSQGFWDAAAQGRLAVQRCGGCGVFQHPPRAMCRECAGTALGFAPVSGEARLWSWTTTHHNVVSGLEAALPYTVLVVELVEQAGLFMLSDLIGRGEIGGLRRGLKMRAVFPAGGPGPVLPQFEPAEGAGS